ncbi:MULTISPECIES: DUF6283 family protein [unclassified Microcoleus]|uniref:DUF6283 family protein n=1 Tax=unclassified Microcoleus TaxID=2642155 RepID=UPI002FD4F557
MQITQTKQCANCPWKVDRDLKQIPDYNRENHEALQRTIADPSLDLLEQLADSNVAMGCHYSTDEKILECVGWIYHQIRNNNLLLRLVLMRSGQIKDLEVDGEQRATFAETLKD